MGDVLVDAGDAACRQAHPAAARGPPGRGARADPRASRPPGSEPRVCEALGIPFWVGERDADAAEDPRRNPERQPDASERVANRFGRPGPPRRPRACARATRSAASRCSTCPATPPATSRSGASPTATLVLGDVLFNMDLFTGSPGCAAARIFTPDPARNRDRPPAGRARAGARLLRPRPAAARPGCLAGFAAGLPA